MRHDYLLCGSIGCCLEVFWTGLHCLSKKDFHLIGHSSPWMFPIYGLGALIRPLSHCFCKFPTWIRGFCYMLGIFATEYTSGLLLKKLNACPWDYSSNKFNYKGLIRLDYAPVWFLTGLFFEKILSQKS